MRIEVNQCWLPADKSALFNLLYTDNYEAIDFFGKYSGVYETENQKAAADSLYYANGTLNTVLANAQVSGMNFVDPDKKEINWVVNGRKESSKLIESKSVKCRANEAAWCTGGVVATECTGEQKLWSEPTTWITDKKPNGGVPVAGDDVIIPPGMIIVFDIAESPVLNLLTVIGCMPWLSDNSKDQHLQAH